jgi:hypothetical protein
VLASPSDVDSERQAASRVVEELNRTIAPHVDYDIRLSRWETDVPPGADEGGPQGVVDQRLAIADADVLVGVFWRRFGTPTGDAGSGTEHEFRLAYEAWKKSARPRLMIYFSNRPYTPQSTEDLEQWSQVLRFKENFPKEGLYWNYKNVSEFEALVRVHLTQVALEAAAAVAPRRRAIQGLLETAVDNTRDLRFVYSATHVTHFVDYSGEPIQYAFTERERRVTAIPDAQGIGIIHHLLEMAGKRERIDVLTAHDFKESYWDDDVILIGSQNANPRTLEALNRHGVPFRFTSNVDGIVDLRSGDEVQWPRPDEESSGADYAILAKLQTQLPAGLATYLIAAGIGGIGTLAACYYLQKNATDMFQEFGASEFALVLCVPDKTDFKAVKRVEHWTRVELGATDQTAMDRPP